MEKDTPKWIDEYARAFHKIASNCVPGEWGPVNYYDVWGLLNGLFIARVAEAIRKVKEKGISIKEAAGTFPSPSLIRLAFNYILMEYVLSEPKNKEQCKEVVEYLIDILSLKTKKDMFAYESNIAHSEHEIDSLIRNLKWQEGTRDIAQALGRFYTTLFGLAYAVYGDFYPANGIEVYGPYDASFLFGPSTILLEKHCFQIRPPELWPQYPPPKHSDIKLFQLYKGVTFKCNFLAMHSQYKGDVIGGLFSWALFVDGKQVTSIEEIKGLTSYFSQICTEQSAVYAKMTSEEKKKKVLEWECYQFVNFFKLAGMDWRPTKAMLGAVKNKAVRDKVIWETFHSFDEYTKSPEHEIYWLKDLYSA